MTTLLPTQVKNALKAMEFAEVVEVVEFVVAQIKLFETVADKYQVPYCVLYQVEAMMSTNCGDF